MAGTETHTHKDKRVRVMLALVVMLYAVGGLWVLAIDAYYDHKRGCLKLYSFFENIIYFMAIFCLWPVFLYIHGKKNS